MKNKLKLVLWGKGLKLPMDYDNLEFDDYELKDNNEYKLEIYKNNEMIKLIWYHKNKNKNFEFNYKNGKLDGKQHIWYRDGKLWYEHIFKNGENYSIN